MPSLVHRYVRHVRVPNLLIVGFVQALVYWRLVRPLDGAPDPLSILFVILSTMLVGAAGFVINDVYDVRTDSINRPDRIVHALSPAQQRAFYALLVMAGGILAAWAGVRLELLHLWWLYPFAVFALWLYSARLKCMPLAGNIWVACFTGGVVVLVGLPVMLYQETAWIDPLFWSYVEFAATTNLYRELVKDLEDLPGDRAAGCTTMPVAWGERAARMAAAVCAGILIARLGNYMFSLSEGPVFLVAAIPAMLTAMSGILLVTARSPRDYGQVSTVIKFVMLAGTVMLFWR